MVRVLRIAATVGLLCVPLKIGAQAQPQPQIMYLYGIQLVKSVSAVVQDTASTPLPNVLVQEFGPNWKTVLRTSTTDSDGGFSFATVEGRKIYWLQLSTPGFNPLRVQVQVDRERGANLKLELTSAAQLAAERDAMLAAEPNRIVFAKSRMSCDEQRAFLAGDYSVVRKMRDLPDVIQRLYMMRDGSRSALADPGEWYEVGDALSELKTPRRRLRFAGVAKDRAFIYYDHGGVGRHLHLDLFRMSSPQDVVGIWHGSATEGDDLESLRHGVSARCEETSSYDM